MKAKDSPLSPCKEFTEALGHSWADAAGRDFTEFDGALRRHIDQCPGCRREADSLVEVDASLASGLSMLVNSFDLPSPERVADTIRRIEAGSEAQLIRKLRRPLRLVLWSALYGFVLLAASVLAVAVYKALASLAAH